MNNTLDRELQEIEAQLTELNPAIMPDELLSRMEQAMMSWENHLPTEEKIVPFSPVESPAESAQATRSLPNNKTFQTWSAAAAVALLLGIVAVFSFSNDSQIQNEITQQTTTPEISASRDIQTSTAKLSRNIIHASNEGITFAGKDETPFKVLRIEYTEKVISRDNDGKPLVIEKPCVEHVLIPVPIN